MIAALAKAQALTRHLGHPVAETELTLTDGELREYFAWLRANYEGVPAVPVEANPWEWADGLTCMGFRVTRTAGYH